MAKKPYIPIYPGDWLKDLGDLSATCQGFALLLLFKIWESKVPGTYKTRLSRLKNLVNLTESESKSALNVLIEVEAFEVSFNSDEITIISRRMLREAEIAKIRSSAGKQGGRPKKANQKQTKSKTKPKQKQNSEYDNDNEDDNEFNIKVWPSFQDFWNLYDKKVSLGKCMSKWDKLTHKTKVEIMDHIPGYKASTQDKKYRLNPLTYLNNEGWKNEIISNGQARKNKSGYSQEFLSELASDKTL